MGEVIKNGLNEDEMREILQEALENFKDDLIREILERLHGSKPEIIFDDLPVSTNEICRRWGKSRTTISKLVKSKALVPSGKYKRQFLFLTSHIIGLLGKPI